jgi:hypothetical protein
MGTDDTGPVEVWARGSRPENSLYNCFTDYSFECTYGNGIHMTGRSGGQRGVKFVGTDGSLFIRVHGGRLEADPPRILTEKTETGEIYLGRSPGHHRNFLDAIRSRGNTVAPAEAGHRTASVCHLINIAMLAEEKLKWDPVAERVIDSRRAGSMVLRPMRSPWIL